MSATDDDLDPQVYSPESVWVPDDDRPEGGYWQPQTWQQIAAERAGRIAELERWRTMVADLDRNEHGRHEGDADVGDPTGVSQGNPLLPAGTVLGYSLGGSWQYVMPERGQRHRIEAWRRQAERPQADTR